jgi:hypothetical protein
MWRCLVIMQESLEQKRKANKQLIKTVPLAATAEYIHLVQRYLLVSKGEGFESVHNEHHLDDLGLGPAVREGKLADATTYAALLAAAVPNTFCIVHDQEQKQVTADCYMADVLRLTSEGIDDWGHRVVNDVNFGIAKAGLQTVKLAAIPCYNISYGPWNTSAWFQQQLEQGSTFRICRFLVVSFFSTVHICF